jgi:hypothetical protein
MYQMKKHKFNKTLITEEITDVMPDSLDEAGGMGDAAAAAPSGPCPACGGAGSVHSGGCETAIAGGLPREGFGYVINPEHKKKHHHHEDEDISLEQSNPSIPDITDMGNDLEEAKLGSGERFAKLKNTLSHEKGITDPGALAASIGRKKYGDAKMSKLAHHEEAADPNMTNGECKDETGTEPLDEGAQDILVGSHVKYKDKHGLDLQNDVNNSFHVVKIYKNNWGDPCADIVMNPLPGDNSPNEAYPEQALLTDLILIPDQNQKPLEEGTYVQSGLSTREAPIPFTQDPSNEGVPDYLTDEEKAAAGARMQQTGMPAESGSSMEESVSILDQFKKGDTVCIDRIHNVEWLVESVSENPDKIVVKNGKRTKVISPKSNFIEHVDGIEVHKERQYQNIQLLREAYMKMDIQADKHALNSKWLTFTESATQQQPEVAVEEKKLPLMEKNDLYSYIKEHEYNKMATSLALQKLCEMYSNPIEEMEKILEDVSLSNTNEGINNMYNFNASAWEENESGLASNLEEAWEKMAKEEMEETARKADEQPGANGGGLGPKQLKFNL